jgi:S-adenosylmethionine hydrolase
LSDFGVSDTYAAQMKAAIVSFSGYDTPIFDLTHMVARGNILQGAFHLAASLPHLPPGSVTLAVVDPGVGSSRPGMAAFWQGRFIVAPDNGLVSLLSGALKAWKLPSAGFAVSPTFHGRDVFAPCAARLAVDPGWTEFLDPLENPVKLCFVKPTRSGDSLQAAVLHVDHFGNCILGLVSGDVSGFVPESLLSRSGEIPLYPVSSYWQSPSCESVLFLQGSQGFFELSVNGGSAAERLGITALDIIVIKGKWTGSE